MMADEKIGPGCVPASVKASGSDSVSSCGLAGGQVSGSARVSSGAPTGGTWTAADERFMREALKEAEAAAEEGEVPVGAVVVCGGRIIARGHNMTETLHDPTAHAEMISITAATEAFGGKYLTDCTIYVTVEPCPMCAAALAWAQIGRVVYGASDPKRGYTLFTPSLLHPKTEVTAGVLAADCSTLVTDFFRAKR